MRNPEFNGGWNERASLAADRTMLSNERTLAAWWRTVMAALAAAIAFAKLFDDVHPSWLIRAAATLLVGLALMMLVVAVRRYERTARRVESESVERVPRIELWLGTILLALASFVAGR